MNDTNTASEATITGFVSRYVLARGQFLNGEIGEKKFKTLQKQIASEAKFLGCFDVVKNRISK